MEREEWSDEIGRKGNGGLFHNNIVKAYYPGVNEKYNNDSEEKIIGWKGAA